MFARLHHYVKRIPVPTLKILPNHNFVINNRIFNNLLFPRNFSTIINKKKDNNFIKFNHNFVINNRIFNNLLFPRNFSTKINKKNDNTTIIKNNTSNTTKYEKKGDANNSSKMSQLIKSVVAIIVFIIWNSLCMIDPSFAIISVLMICLAILMP